MEKCICGKKRRGVVTGWCKMERLVVTNIITVVEAQNSRGQH